eukprot:6626357-Alexandrium_andersonii.AAC.1
MQVARNASPTAGGLDGWRPCELKYWSATSFDWTARLLSLVENGAQWPSQLTHGRTAILEKPYTSKGDPLSY